MLLTLFILCRVYFWDGRRYGAQLSRQDLKDMIMDEPIASNCIECYGILLTDQLLEKESQGLDVPTFMNPLCWVSSGTIINLQSKQIILN